MRIEEMKESHLLQVAEIENKCFSHPWSLKSLESELKNNGSHFYVSVEDDKVLGYIGMNVVVDEGYIFNVAVDENARKKGIGTSLTFNNLSLYPTYNILDGALDKRIYDIKISDYYLENGNYVNIEYITLGYNIPVKKLKIEKYLKSLRLAFSVNNVATITGYSGMTPLINSANVASKSSVSGTLGVDDKLIYPLSRTYSLSLGVKF